MHSFQCINCNLNVNIVMKVNIFNSPWSCDIMIRTKLISQVSISEKIFWTKDFFLLQQNGDKGGRSPPPPFTYITLLQVQELVFS